MAGAIDKQSRANDRRRAIVTDRKLRKDLRLLARFVGIYCAGRHATAEKAPLALRTHDVAALGIRCPQLCQACTKLIAHAFVKRASCPLDPKPMCKRCPTHCYAPHYREEIRAVMKYAGIRMVLRGRLDYLLHLLF